MAKKRVNSKAKGNRTERQVVKLLSEWWKEEFTRTPSSGMFASTHVSQLKQLGYDLSGDIICPKNFPFNVEVKSRKTIDLYEIIRNGKDSELFSWWKQSVDDAKRSKKAPLVIFKENSKQFYCLIGSVTFALLTDPSEFCNYGSPRPGYEEPQITLMASDGSFVIVQLKELMEIPKNDIIDGVPRFAI